MRHCLWTFLRLVDAVGPVRSRLPTLDGLDVSGLDLTTDQLRLLLSVDVEIWRKEAALIPPFYEKFGDRLPKALWAEYEALVKQLAAAAPAMAAAE